MSFSPFWRNSLYHLSTFSNDSRLKRHKIYAEAFFPNYRVENSTPIVEVDLKLNSFLVNLVNKLLLPTPESPIRTILNKRSKSSCCKSNVIFNKFKKAKLITVSPFADIRTKILVFKSSTIFDLNELFFIVKFQTLITIKPLNYEI
ncbi:hypothetical protein BpHYR1_038885 [Brachionus plicatilis]|uniref:Uncharacterized protein n=1 Tax=Brachionus plicatilis TaxID=10195 RepID=A0A3M7RLH8_BRAPC|nr:hypothetical protein BpHYR1_038885 [Brachionus plicatilis]